MARGAWRACAQIALAIGALATFSAATADAQTARTRLAQVERDRRAESARAEHLRAEAAAAQREVRSLDLRLVESGRRRAEAEAAATAAEERLLLLQQQMNTESQRRANARLGFESALIAAAFADRRLEVSAVRRNILARATAPTFVAEERSSSRALAEAVSVSAAITQERQILAEAQTAIDGERAELAQLLQRRRAAQTHLAQNADAAERRARTLTAEARNLRELAQRVQVAAHRPAPASPSAIPASWMAPAEGRMVRNFGAREAGGAPSQGIALRTRASAQVSAPAPGRVAYAGLFRSYGQVLILDLDGGYVLVLTGLGDIHARVGDAVRPGQPVGEMPATDTPAPELYVEVRRNGQPVDPGRWLSARGLSAERNVRAG